MKLTERRIEALAVANGGKDRLVFDDAQRGLAVRVTASGGRTYLCQYTLHGRKWRVPLGACSAVSLSKAREAAAAIMGDLAKGRNPATDRKEAAAAERAKRVRNRLTLRVLIDDWHRHHLSGRRLSYATEAVRALHRAFADQLDDAAEDLDRTTVVHALDALARRHKGMGDAASKKPRGSAITGRTAAYGRAAYAWAMKRGAVPVNPFTNLPISKGIAKRERVLSDDELGEIWRATAEVGTPYGTMVRMLILTGQRRGEVSGMNRSEISDDLAIWTMPGERTKNGAVHVVPLSAPVRALLKDILPRVPERAVPKSRMGVALVFPGVAGATFSGWSKAKLALDKAILDGRVKAAAASRKDAAPLIAWSLHDLRRTVATGLQRLGVRLEVTESVLNHLSGSRGGIAGVYQRHDWANEKRCALDAWASHVQVIVENWSTRPNIVHFASAPSRK